MSDYDPTDTQSQERDRQAAEQRSKRAKDSEAADLKWLMGSKRGRRIMWRDLDQAGLFRLSFNTNAMQMAFAEGNKNIGLRKLALIHTLCPELYPVMVREAKEPTANDDRNTDND